MINIFSIFKFFADAFTFNAGPSGGGSSTTTTSNVPEYMKQNYKDLYDIASQQIFQTDAEGNITGFKPYVGYSANPADYVAGFSPMQQQSFTGAANLSVPGQYGQATDLAGAAGMGGINSAQQAYNYGQLGSQYGAQGAGYGDISAQIGQMGLQAQQTGQGITQQSQDLAAQQAAAGDIYQQMATNPNAVQAYMSPYQQAVTQQAIDSAYRNAAIQKTGRQATAAKAGAFGGSRQAIENAEADRALNTQIQAIQATGDQAAYDKAIQSMQYGTTLGMQGLGGAQSGLGTALQGGQLGLSGIGTALQGLQGGMQGAGLGMQGAGVGLQGVAGAQSGYGVANQAGANLANIGTAQNVAAQSILDQQNQFGGQQQANQQQVINNAIAEYGKAQGFSQDQISYLNALLHGTPSLGSTRTTYAGAPDPFSTAIGAGTVLAGAASRPAKEGGIIKLAQGGAIKGYADGGVTGVDNVEKIAGKLSIPQLQQAMQNQTVPEYVGIPLLQMKTQEAQRAQAAQAAMQQGQQGGQPPSIKDQIMQQAQQMQGIEGLPSNLPTEEMADGGIVAFGQGGDVPGYFKGGVPETQEEFNSLPLEEQQRILDRMGLTEGFKKTGAAAMDLATLPGRAIMGAAETGITRPLRALGVPIPYLPESAYGGDRSSMTPFYDKYVRGQESQTKPKGSAQSGIGGVPLSDYADRQKEYFANYKGSYAPQGRGNEGLGGSTEAKARAGAGAGGARGAGGAPEWKDFTPTKLDETLYDDRLKNKPTLESASEEMKKRRKEYGIDDELYTKQRADIAKEKEDVTKRLKEADSDSMIMAGLRMLSGTPISEAALTEFKQNALTKKDLRAEDRVLRKENNEIDRAEQARNEARLSGDTARFDKYDAEYKALVDKKQSRIDHNIDAVNDAARSNQTMRFNKDLKVWEVNTEQAGLNRRAQMSTDMYSKLLGQDIKTGTYNANQIENMNQYIWGEGGLKGTREETILKQLGADLSEADVATLPANRKKMYIEARRKYDRLKSEAQQKFGTIDAPSRLGSLSGGGGNIRDFNSLK